jgi:hypothetical protein
MATFRVGVGSFNIKDGAVGFGTDTDGLGNLRVKGVTKTTDVKVSGASTLTRYSGFAADNINQLENITLTSEVGTIGDIVVGVGTSVIISSASTVTVGTVESVSIGTHFSPPVGGIEERGQDFIEGMMRFNVDLNTMEFYNGNEWRQFKYISDIQNSPGSRGRGLWAGGTPAPLQFTVDFVNIASRGNTKHWGDMRVGRYIGQNAVGGETRVVFCGGYGLSPSPETSDTNAMDYGVIQSGGQCVDFGNLTRTDRGAGTGGNSTRGIYWGGQSAPAERIDYFQIHTVGDAIEFVNLGGSARSGQMCSASPVKLVRSPSGGSVSDMASLIFSTTGAVTDFGDARTTSYYLGTASSGVRGILAGGTNPLQSPSTHVERSVQHYNFASGGNTTPFGDLIQGSAYAGASSMTRGCFSSFYSQANSGHVESIEIASDGNGVDFGDSEDHFASGIGASDCHGGLGGY